MRLPCRLALLLTLGLAAAMPAAASAEQLVVDFETGPALGTPVTDEYLPTAFVQWIKDDPGWRPYRLQAAGKARSGSVVANVDGRQCAEEDGPGIGCEFPAALTEARLKRSARSVTVYAGLFDARDGVYARLTGFRADTTTVVGAVVPISDAGFTTPISVTSSTFDVIRWRLEAVNAGGDLIGAPLGFDDLSIEYDPAALPDIVPSTTMQTVAALQGQTVEAPLDITRINGSDGPVQVSVGGLPAGVTAEVVPNPVPGTTETATIRLSAAPDAPVTGTNAVEATITADPQSNAGVAPAARTTKLKVRVADPFALRLPAGAGDLVELPACAPVEVRFDVARDVTYRGDVSLTVEGLPAGVGATILPDATARFIGSSGVGNFLFNARTIRLTRDAGVALPPSFVVRATAPGLADRTMTLRLARATPSATLTSAVGLTPRRRQDGTKMTITGNGFCPGTTLRVGNSEAVADATLVDPTTVTFNVPRLATPGPVTIVRAGEPSYTTSNTLQVRTYRNTNGFQFDNYPYGHLSIDELADAFGADDLFIKVNPCWPWGSCTIVTGILNPIAAIAWGVIDIALHQSGGHCFGISRAVQQLVSGKKSLNSFNNSGTIFSIPSASGPSAFLEHYLDGQHALQASSQFLSGFLFRSDNIFDQISKLDTELRANRDAIVSIAGPDFGQGHAMLAYDLQTTMDGYDIFVYDNNQPYTPREDTDATHHKSVEGSSVIHYNRFTQEWSFPGLGWSSGNDGKLFVAPQALIPDNPSLPGLTTLAEALSSLVFGSADGSVRTVAGSGSKGAEFVPVLDSNAPPAAAGQWIAAGTKPVSAEFQGVKAGRYDQAVTSPGFVGGITGVATSRGVRDRLTGAPGSLTFEGGERRALNIELARQGRSRGATAWSATIKTTGSAKGEDSAALTPAGALRYAHDGASTRMSFSLSRLRADGGPERFDSGPLHVGRGDRLSITPSGAGLRRLRVTTRSAGGRTVTRTLRNRAKRPARLSLSRLVLGGRRASVRVRVAALRGQAAGGVVLRLKRGTRTVARRSLALKQLRNGTRTVRFTVPGKVKRGRYRLVADARVSAIATTRTPVAGSATAHRSVAVRVK